MTTPWHKATARHVYNCAEQMMDQVLKLKWACLFFTSPQFVAPSFLFRSGRLKYCSNAITCSKCECRHLSMAVAWKQQQNQTRVPHNYIFNKIIINFTTPTWEWDRAVNWVVARMGTIREESGHHLRHFVLELGDRNHPGHSSPYSWVWVFIHLSNFTCGFQLHT